MMTAIKNLGKKLTGKDIDGTNLVTVVDDIANKYNGSGGGGGGGDNGNLVLKLSEAEKIDDYRYSFSPLTIKDCFDAASSGRNIVLIDDLLYNDNSIGQYNLYVPDSVNYYVSRVDDGYNSGVGLSFSGAYSVNAYDSFEEGDTVDSWLDQPLIIALQD